MYRFVIILYLLLPSLAYAESQNVFNVNDEKKCYRGSANNTEIRDCLIEEMHKIDALLENIEASYIRSLEHALQKVTHTEGAFHSEYEHIYKDYLDDVKKANKAFFTYRSTMAGIHYHSYTTGSERNTAHLRTQLQLSVDHLRRLLSTCAPSFAKLDKYDLTKTEWCVDQP